MEINNLIRKTKKRWWTLLATSIAIANVCMLGVLPTAKTVIFYDGCTRWTTPNRYLEIRNVSNNEVLFKSRISLGDKFLIKYTHSLTNRPIEEVFEIDKEGRIILCETIFDSLGFGGPQPHMNDHWIIVGDKIRIYDINKPIQELLLRVSYLHEHLFILNNKEIINLRMVSDPGDLIRIKVYN